jgi:hypothetical protein
MKRCSLSRTTAGAIVLVFALLILSAVTWVPVQGQVLEPLSGVSASPSTAAGATTISPHSAPHATTHHQAARPPRGQTPPDLCVAASGTPQTVRQEPFDSLAGWHLNGVATYSKAPPASWVVTTTLPGGRTGSAAYAEDPEGGSCAGDYTDYSSYWFMVSDMITIPTGDILARLAFDHYLATEAGWDGGNLQISINGGAFVPLSTGTFIYNGYNTTLTPTLQGNTNPLAGQPAFSGTTGGLSLGTWGTSIVNLAARGVGPGDKIRLRYNFGINGCLGEDGWYIDQLQVYTCLRPQPVIQIPVIASGGVTATTSSPTQPVSQTFAVYNTGDADLNWEIIQNPAPKLPVLGISSQIACDLPGAIPWLTLDPITGTIPPGSSNTLVATANPTGLATGTYAANICIRSNAKVEPEVIRVALVVRAPTAITGISLTASNRPWPMVALIPIGLLLLGAAIASRRHH